jgi:Fic family protein
MIKPLNEEVNEFLEESNAIERVYSTKALEDALVAWKYASKIDVLDLEDVLKIHFLLLKNINPRIAGKLRDCDVWIGGNLKKFMSREFLTKQLKDWVKNFNNYLKTTKIIDNKLKHDFTRYNHVQFENIHPFEDGNGRVGRILYNILRLKLGLPIHIIYEGEEQQNYYRWF